MSPAFIATAALSAIVFWRVGAIAARTSRAAFGCGLRFQGFALGYGVLGLGAALVLVDAWKGTAGHAELALLLASALLIAFDRRGNSP